MPFPTHCYYFSIYIHSDFYHSLITILNNFQQFFSTYLAFGHNNFHMLHLIYYHLPLAPPPPLEPPPNPLKPPPPKPPLPPNPPPPIHQGGTPPLFLLLA